MLKLVYSLLVALFLFSCTPKTFVIMPDYEGKTISNASLLVVLTESPIIENSDDVIDDLGEGVPGEVYLDFFNTQFVKQMKKVSLFKKIMIDSSIGRIKMKELQESLTEEEKIKIKIPQKNDPIVFNQEEIDFILLIQELRIYRKAGESGTWTYGAPGQAGTYSGGSNPELVHFGKFTIWDNKRSQLVSFGKIVAGKAFLFAMGKNDWTNCLLQVAGNVVADSPFKSKYKVR